jgi:hypothetical protein
MKNHYLLTQITDIMVQLFENGLKVLREGIQKNGKRNILKPVRSDSYPHIDR